jgi:sugar lactone lactonase YvrE
VLGVRCCGAPVIDGTGRVRGAISVAGPTFRLTMPRLELLGPEIAQAARRIGAQLDATQARSPHGPVTVVDGPWAFRGAYPLWSEGKRALYWADALGPALHVADGRRDRVVTEFDSPLDTLLLHDDGVAVGQAEGWSLVDGGGAPHRAGRLPRRRLRAASVRPDGMLWACLEDGERWRISDLSAGGQPSGGWHLNEPAEALAWNEEGNTAYAVAPESGTVYELREGNATVRRVATLPKASGTLSGVAVDRAGGVWTALQDGWSVVRFGADGALDRVVAVPVPSPTDVAFGGAALDTLYVTTARANLSREALANAPLAGRLLSIKSEFGGTPATPWRHASR